VWISSWLTSTPLVTPRLEKVTCATTVRLARPGTVMDEMGHTDPALALRVYRQAMRRGEGDKAALRALVEGTDSTPVLRQPTPSVAA
jgi:hypothetical protein